MFAELDSSILIELLMRFSLNIVAMIILIFGMYYQRYRDKELVIAAAMFNVFIFAVLTILSSVEFGIAAGFGLFAILAMFTLRSEQISKTEIAYFFGSISIAVICSIQGTTVSFILLVVIFLLISAYVIDHPKVLSSVYSLKLTLDRIDPEVLSEPEKMRAELSSKLGVEVMSFQVTSLNHIDDKARVNVFYRKRK
jgi:hypothetical protein